MAFIEIEKCLENPDFLNSRFMLTNLAAKRAADLILMKDHPLIEDSRFRKPTTLALEEIITGKLTLIHRELPKV